MVEYKSLYHEAEERVSVRHPKPKFEPFTAVMTGFIAAGAASVAFSTFAGMDVEAFPVALIFTSALGLIAPYLYFRQAHKDYWMKVISDHRLREKSEHDGSEKI